MKAIIRLAFSSTGVWLSQWAAHPKALLSSSLPSRLSIVFRRNLCHPCSRSVMAQMK